MNENFYYQNHDLDVIIHSQVFAGEIECANDTKKSV